ncbi:dual specificity mitogen-activated protein kinase kinase 1-like protein [Aphelenchoides avenae]|nr:dual specificity mitogen-activated protein kinase kinase 1-like protein [Aphelenchus avenae]
MPKTQNGSVHVDGFDILDVVGRGAFGVVNKVVERSTGREMARKLIPIQPRKEENEKIIARIKQELLVLSDCNCDNIVAFYGAHSDDKHLSLFMELMDMSLHDMILNVGLVPEKHISWITVNTLNAVRYSNRRSEFYIEPANILVNAAGEVKLCDLGICATLSKLKSTASSWVGTQTYMSPERLNGNGSTVSSEVWSLGMILIEAAIGRYPIPHVETSEIAVIQRKLSLLERHEWMSLENVQQRWLRATRKRVTNFAIVELMAQLWPPPLLPAGIFSNYFRDFTSKCLAKTPGEQASVDELLSHAFVDPARNRRADSQMAFSAFIQVSSER